jgi:hypothetical protein
MELHLFSGDLDTFFKLPRKWTSVKILCHPNSILLCSYNQLILQRENHCVTNPVCLAVLSHKERDGLIFLKWVVSS